MSRFLRSKHRHANKRAPTEADAPTQLVFGTDLIPAPTAVEAAAKQQQNYNNDDEQSGRVHGCLLRSSPEKLRLLLSVPA